MLLGDAEQLANELGPIAQVLLDQLGADDAQESGFKFNFEKLIKYMKLTRGLIGNGLGQERLASTGWAIEDDAFRWTNAHLFIVLGMGQGQLD